MLMLAEFDWTQLLVVLGPVTAGVLGIGVVWAKASKIQAAFVQLGELFASIGASLEDKQVTSSEVQTIIKEVKETGEAIKGIFTK